MVHDPRVSAQLSRLGGVYRDPARVDRDASSLLKSSVGSHLTPITTEMVQNNGNSSLALVLQGTIAIHFRGNTYQQLVDIYLPAGYPRSPPVPYVRLAENMYLKENHPHVGSDGQVYLPYLHEWSVSTHNLVELVVAMSSVFSAEPPVFSRAEPPPPPTPPAVVVDEPPPPAYSAADYSTQSEPHHVSSWQRDAEAILAAEAAEANAAAQAAREAEAEAKRAEEQAAKQRQLAQDQLIWEQARCNSIRDQVALKIRHHLSQRVQECQTIAQQDMRDQQKLQVAQEKKIDLQMNFLKQKEQELQQQLQVVEERTEDIQAWLEQASSSQTAPLSIDEQVQPATPLHAQMLELSAENAILADTLYFLDRGLDRGHLDCASHLKQVRKVAKRQFLVRAHLIKINQVLLDKKSNGQQSRYA